MDKFCWPIHISQLQRLVFVLICIFTTLAMTGCDLATDSDLGPDYQETLVNLQVQQTMVAEDLASGIQQTASAQNATLQAQQTLQASQLSQIPIASPTMDTQLSVQETIQAQQPTPNAQPAPTETTAIIKPSPTVDLQSQIKSANILLYEDMVSETGTNRYVKDTLDRMGLSYKDDGNAQGWFKSDILNGSPDGGPWDLVIVAAEAKSGVQGEFFEYISDALNKGSSVILEVWYLDQIAAGAASSLLDQCGVEFEKDWSKVPPSRMVMFPLDSSHPIMREPNPSLSFTKVTSYWWDETLQNIYDIGDWMKISSGGDARLLVGTIAAEKMTHGTVAVCIDDRLIIQTFSSHQLTYNSMTYVWENYIYNALRVRFENPNP